MPRRSLVALACAASSCIAGNARAESEPWEPGHRTTSHLPAEIDADRAAGAGDGVYGRFDGLLDLGLEAGALFDGGAPSGAVLASLHYMFMAGFYVGYSDAFAKDESTRRAVSFGVDVRPAFIPRWSNNLQLGNGFTDLVIDSISLGVGAYFRTPRGGSFGDRRGLDVSLGFGVPLVGQVDGPWLGVRGYLRWDDPTAQHAPGAEALGLATLGWHFMAFGG